MKRFRSSLFTSSSILLLALAGCSDDSGKNPGDRDGGAQPDKLAPDTVYEPADDPAVPFALVELFTSEGCNSCPSAEQNVSSLMTQTAAGKLRAFFVAWHVDYWNYLGWTDPFSSKAHSDRQTDYARAMGSSTRYTPQMIVNGTAVVRPASSNTYASDAIRAALQQSTSVSVTIWITAGAASGNELKVAFKTKNAPAGSELYVVFVERGIVITPTAGENRGRTLTHDSTVRAYAKASAAARGTVTIAVPTSLPAVKRENTSLIAFVQDPGNKMKIVGATGIDLKQSK
jgi:hypothetical protein